jgi:hypothetical protein
MSVFMDSGHLFRLAALYAIGTLTFLGIRAFFVPRSFGQYGHYRGAAIAEIAAHPIHYAGHQACETCHTDVQEMKRSGMHAQVNCEACHGPLAKHADDPSIQPAPADTQTATTHTAPALPSTQAGGAFSVVGKAMLGIAGAYLLRAMAMFPHPHERKLPLFASYPTVIQ